MDLKKLILFLLVSDMVDDETPETPDAPTENVDKVEAYQTALMERMTRGIEGQPRPLVS